MVQSHSKDIDSLIAMGFSEASSRKALEKYGGLQNAVDALLSENVAMFDASSSYYSKNVTPASKQLMVIPVASTGQSSAGFQTSDVNNSPSSTAPMMDLTGNGDDDDLARAIEESLSAKNAVSSTAVTLWGNPLDHVRRADSPCGLQNVGNTCYLSSLLQVYFYIPKLRQAILGYNPTQPEVSLACVTIVPSGDQMEIDPAVPSTPITDPAVPVPVPAVPVPVPVPVVVAPDSDLMSDGVPTVSAVAAMDPSSSQPSLEPLTIMATAVIEPSKSSGVSETADSQKKAAIRVMVLELRKLFALMMFSKRSSVNPSNLVNSLVDSEGKRIQIGDQQDVTEFNVILLNVLETAFAEALPFSAPSLKRRRSDTSIERTPEKNPIRELFASYFVSHITAVEEDGSPAETDQSSEDVTQLILPVSVDGSTHASLETYTHDEIESFVTKKKHTCTASRDLWFTSFAPYLIVQLQRVQFDAESQTAKKDNTRFRADEIVCLERYMSKNKEDVENIRGKQQDLRRIATGLSTTLQPLQNFESSSLSQSRILELAGKILGDNAAVADLQRLASDKEAHTESVIHQKSEVEEDISHLFSKIDENGQLHELKAVLIHGGDHLYGHYVAYVRINGRDWWHFSDAQVKQVTAAEVMSSCTGTNTSSSAYFLLYEIQNAATVVEPDLPRDLQDYTDAHNADFEKEQKDWILRLQREEVQRRIGRFRQAVAQTNSAVVQLADPADEAYYLKLIEPQTPSAGVMFDILVAHRASIDILSPKDLPPELRWEDVELLLKNELRHNRWNPEDEYLTRMKPWLPFVEIFRELCSALYISISHVLEHRFLEAAVVASKLFFIPDENIITCQPEELKKMLMIVLIAALEGYLSVLKLHATEIATSNIPLAAKVISHVRNSNVKLMSGKILIRFVAIRSEFQGILSRVGDGALKVDVLAATVALMQYSPEHTRTVREAAVGLAPFEMAHLREMSAMQLRFRNAHSVLAADLGRTKI